MRSLAALRTAVALAGLSGAIACVGQLEPSAPRTAEEFTGGRELYDLDALVVLRDAAEAAPNDLRAQWKAGLAHTRASLVGHVDQREYAERYLERAWRLDPQAERVPAARVLARFLNMRSAVLDLSGVELQIELYASLLDDSPGTRGPAPAQSLEPEQFHFASFHAAAEALATYGDGRTLAALRQVDALERSMAARTEAYPGDIDSWTMAATFELNFAGAIPIGVGPRLRRGIEALEIQQDHWDELSPRARNTSLAPNVRSVFAIQLAESLLAAGEVEAAAARYEAVLGFDDVAATRPRAQIVALAEHRLGALDDYAGSRELLPPWPAGVSACVACHGREASLPTDDLHLGEGVQLEVRWP